MAEACSSPPGSPSAFAAGVNRVLADDDLRAEIGQRAYAHSRRMVWSEVGDRYRRLFDLVGVAPRSRRHAGRWRPSVLDRAATQVVPDEMTDSPPTPHSRRPTVDTSTS